MAAEGFILMVIVIVVVAIGATKSRNDAINRAWGKVARQLGLTLEPAALRSSPRLSGNVTGHDLTVDIKKRGGGQHRSVWTRFRLGMPPLGLGLKLKSEGFLDGITKVFGTQDIEVGDAAFDDRVLIQGPSEKALREFLTPERRQVIERFLSSFGGAVVTDDAISLSSRGYMRSPDQVHDAIDAMLQVARALTGADAGASAAMVDAVEQERSKDVTSLDPAIPEAEPAETSDTEVEARIEATVPLMPPDSPGVDAFCDTVFAPGALSFAATQSFQKEFAGKRIAWSGMLESAAAYSFDFDFGARKGIKAVLGIRPDASDSSGAREVKAVLSLPADLDGLQDRIGQHVTFGGTLFKVDGLARRVFIADAEIDSPGS